MEDSSRGRFLDFPDRCGPQTRKKYFGNPSGSLSLFRVHAPICRLPIVYHRALVSPVELLDITPVIFQSTILWRRMVSRNSVFFTTVGKCKYYAAAYFPMGVAHSPFPYISKSIGSPFLFIEKITMCVNSHISKIHVFNL